MMARLMKRNLPLLRLLTNVPARRRKQILQHAPRELVQALSEGALNVLHGNVPLTKKTYARLKRHKKQLHLLADRRVPERRKRKLIIQRGGFLPLLAGALLPLISGIGSAILGGR